MCLCVREGARQIESRACSHGWNITYIQRIFQTLPLVKFSITRVNRGQWEKNKYLHLSWRPQPSPLPAQIHTHTHTHTHCLTLAVSPSDCLLGSLTHHDKCPFLPRTIFSAMSDMGILMNAQWQYLGRRADTLPRQIYPQVTSVRQERKKLRKQTGAGQKLISSPRLKTHLSK